jgi:peptide/nickel transport system permease protein
VGVKNMNYPLPMMRFLLRRSLTLLATVLAASAVIFAALDVLPGNIAQVLLGPDASEEAVQALAQQLGLEQPAWQRYAQWLSGLLRFDLGLSHAYGSPVGELILERLSLTLPLALMAMLFTTVLALGAGVYAASRQHRLGDVGVMGLSQLGIAIPNFWFAILLIMLFSVHLRWFAAGGFDGWSEGLGAGLKALLLPALSLAVVQAAILARITRSAMLEVLREDFVRTARAKGRSLRSAMWTHALRNAMIPVVTVMGLQFANLVAGTVVIENVFYLPGLGRLIFQSIANRDLVVVRNGVMLLAVMVVAINFVVDVLYAIIDPRLQGHDSA